MSDDPEQATRLGDGEGLKIAEREDFGVTRGSDGDLLPVTQQIPGTDMGIKVYPLVDGKSDEYEDVLEGDERDPERVDALFRECIAEGIGSDGYEDIPDYVREGLIAAIKNSNGHQVFRAVQEQQAEELKSQMALVDAVGAENIEQLAALSENEPS